ncbi:MAG: hypothetical protein JSU66_10170 [Deltaproteobacteria bacterium]|nr:MAG: hypothetical protein JSU66_10170 [Deltaproteobacteria bacterium]
MILVGRDAPHRVNANEFALLMRLDMDAATRRALGDAFADASDVRVDGCTASPDRLPPAWLSQRFVRIWLACVVHDLQYARGGSRAERRISDQMLRSNWLRLAWFACQVGRIGAAEARLIRAYVPVAYRLVRLFGGRHWTKR